MREEEKVRPKGSKRGEVRSSHGSQMGKWELDREGLVQSPVL